MAFNPLSNLLVSLLSSKLENSLRNFKKEDFNYSFTKGLATLSNVELKKEIIQERLNFPSLDVRRVHINNMVIKMKLRKYPYVPVKLNIDEVNVVLQEPVRLHATPEAVQHQTNSKEKKYGTNDRILEGMEIYVNKINVSIQFLGRFKTEKIGYWSPPSIEMVFRYITLKQTDSSFNPISIKESRSDSKKTYITVYKRLSMELLSMVLCGEKIETSLLVSNLPIQVNIINYKTLYGALTIDRQHDVLIDSLRLNISYSAVKNLLHVFYGFIDSLGRVDCSDEKEDEEKGRVEREQNVVEQNQKPLGSLGLSSNQQPFTQPLTSTINQKFTPNSIINLDILHFSVKIFTVKEQEMKNGMKDFQNQILDFISDSGKEKSKDEEESEKFYGFEVLGSGLNFGMLKLSQSKDILVQIRLGNLFAKNFTSRRRGQMMILANTVQVPTPPFEYKPFTITELYKKAHSDKMKEPWDAINTVSSEQDTYMEDAFLLRLRRKWPPPKPPEYYVEVELCIRPFKTNLYLDSVSQALQFLMEVNIPQPEPPKGITRYKVEYVNVNSLTRVAAIINSLQVSIPSAYRNSTISLDVFLPMTTLSVAGELSTVARSFKPVSPFHRENDDPKEMNFFKWDEMQVPQRVEEKKGEISMRINVKVHPLSVAITPDRERDTRIEILHFEISSLDIYLSPSSRFSVAKVPHISIFSSSSISISLDEAKYQVILTVVEDILMFFSNLDVTRLISTIRLPNRMKLPGGESTGAKYTLSVENCLDNFLLRVTESKEDAVRILSMPSTPPSEAVDDEEDINEIVDLERSENFSWPESGFVDLDGEGALELQGRRIAEVASEKDENKISEAEIVQTIESERSKSIDILLVEMTDMRGELLQTGHVMGFKLFNAGQMSIKTSTFGSEESMPTSLNIAKAGSSFMKLSMLSTIQRKTTAIPGERDIWLNVKVKETSMKFNGQYAAALLRYFLRPIATIIPKSYDKLRKSTILSPFLDQYSGTSKTVVLENIAKSSSQGLSILRQNKGKFISVLEQVRSVFISEPEKEKPIQQKKRLINIIANLENVEATFGGEPRELHSFIQVLRFSKSNGTALKRRGHPDGGISSTVGSGVEFEGKLDASLTNAESGIGNSKLFSIPLTVNFKAVPQGKDGDYVISTSPIMLTTSSTQISESLSIVLDQLEIIQGFLKDLAMEFAEKSAVIEAIGSVVKINTQEGDKEDSGIGEMRENVKEELPEETKATEGEGEYSQVPWSPIEKIEAETVEEELGGEVPPLPPSEKNSENPPLVGENVSRFQSYAPPVPARRKVNNNR